MLDTDAFFEFLAAKDGVSPGEARKALAERLHSAWADSDSSSKIKMLFQNREPSIDELVKLLSDVITGED